MPRGLAWVFGVTLVGCTAAPVDVVDARRQAQAEVARSGLGVDVRAPQLLAPADYLGRCRRLGAVWTFDPPSIDARRALQRAGGSQREAQAWATDAQLWGIELHCDPATFEVRADGAWASPSTGQVLAIGLGPRTVREATGRIGPALGLHDVAAALRQAAGRVGRLRVRARSSGAERAL